MELVSTYACDGCKCTPFELRVVDDARLCATCAEKSAQIDRDLETTRSDDPVACDACGADVEFDARVAVVARACGGSVRCADCKSVSIEGEPRELS